MRDLVIGIERDRELFGRGGEGAAEAAEIFDQPLGGEVRMTPGEGFEKGRQDR